MDFVGAVPSATFAVLLRTDEAATAFKVSGLGLAESAVGMDVGRGLLVSAVDDTAIAKWARQAKGADLIRRLTLADLKAELDLDAEFYDSISIEVSIDAKRREHEMLVAKVKGVESVVVRAILDPGFLSRARVLTITFVVEDGEWVVVKYVITQYATTSVDITSQDPVVFLVSDYEEAGDKKFERCRRDVAECKVTGGKGEEVWVKERVENSDEDFDAVTKKLTEMVGNYSNVVGGIAGGALNVVDRKFPRGARARQQSAPPRRDAKGAAGGGRLDSSVGDRLLKMFQTPAAEAEDEGSNLALAPAPVDADSFLDEEE